MSEIKIERVTRQVRQTCYEIQYENKDPIYLEHVEKIDFERHISNVKLSFTKKTEFRKISLASSCK